MHRITRLLSCLFIVILAASVGLAGQQDIKETPANTAASVRIVKSSLETELAGQKAPAGKSYLLLETEWQNIHPKQKVKKSDAEGKPDRTMGVGGLMGGKKSEKEEYVEADVAYQVPNLFDHIYCLADGQSYALDKLTEQIPGGAQIKSSLTIQKFGEKKQVNLVYLVPAPAKNLAFQFFDYTNGHILIPIAGDLKLARGSGGAAAKALDQIKDSYLELAALKLDFQKEFHGEEAPEGWRYALVDLGGMSLSGGSVKNIVQIEPREYIWLQTKEGYLYYCSGATTTEDGFVRFTPEVYQSQNLGFLVPAQTSDFALGVRIQNKVYSLNLGKALLPEIPKAAASHTDGRTMEIMLFGMKREGGKFILDLGIKSLVNSGIEIQTEQQFILKVGDEDVTFDETATSSGFHRPPKPFTVPPKTFVRFELAYETEGVPTSLYYRGYESEKYFELKTKD